MLRVTFDSNVWRKVASPERFQKDPSRQVYELLHCAVKEQRIIGLLPETIFNLETIQTKQRQQFFGNYRPSIESQVVSATDEGIHMRVKIGPDLNAHPGNSAYHNIHLADALSIGFRLLSAPRVALPRSPDIKREYFFEEDSDKVGARLDRYHAAGREIEALGCGMAHIRALGQRYARTGEIFLDGLRSVPESEKHLISKAIAEWADGDAIAAHIGYEADFFCTHDQGISAGSDSILSAKFRQIIAAKYGVRFVLPDELATLLKENGDLKS